MSEKLAGIRPDRDAMGHMLLAHLEGDHPIEIVEREDGFIGASDHVGMYFAPYAEWSPVEQQAILRCVPGPSLDLGCGAGRVALYLQEQGHAVVAIDNSPLAVEVCRRRGVLDARVLSITQVGPQIGAFANIIMFGNNWGLLANRSRARWLLRRFYHMTLPGARIIAASNDVYQTDNPIHLAYQAHNRARGRMSGQLRLRVRYQIHASPWFDYLIVSPGEMRELLSGTGWRLDEVITGEGSLYCAVIVKEDQ